MSELRDFVWQGIPAMWNIPSDSIDDRTAPIFFGAIPGASAYASNETQTLFSDALFQCLDRIAADEPEVGDADDRWRVTVSSLTRRLPVAIADVRKRFNVAQDWAPGGLPKDATIVYLNDRPLTTVTMSIDPPEAREFFRFVYRDEATGNEKAVAPIDPHPHDLLLPVGLYQFAAKFAKNDPRYVEVQKAALAKLPVSPPWRAKVSP